MPSNPNISTTRADAGRPGRHLRLGPLLAVLLLAAGLFGALAHAQQFQARLLDQTDGLGDLSVTAFAQQPDGHLWVATIHGVFRYDGSTFTEFGLRAGLTDPSVFSLLIDPAGILWAGTHGGLFRFDGQVFHEVRVGTTAMRVGVNSMLASAPNGELVVETSNGMISVEREGGIGEWKAVPYRHRHPAFPASQSTDGIAVDPSGRLWFGDNGMLCAFTGGKVQRYGPAQGVPDDIYVSLFAERDGRMWARGRKHILTWRPGDAAMQDLTSSFPAGAIATVNRRFTEDAWGRILTPTTKGFATWDQHTWKETTTTSAGSIDGATDLFADHENTIWIGTDGAGLLHSLGYGLWENYSAESGLGSPAVGSFAADRGGRIWVGNNPGASILDPGAHEFRPSPLAGEAEASYIQALAPDPQGGMWAGALLGHIFHISAQGRVDVRLSLDAYIERLRLDGKGVLWIVTSKGLYQLRGEGRHAAPQLVTGGALASEELSDAVLAVDDSVWVAGSQGLDRVANGSVTHYTLPPPLTGLQNLCLARDGTLWLSGPSSGVLHVRVEGQTLRVLERYALAQLTSDLISFLDTDSKGRLWIGTDRGASVISGGTVFHITDEDGLIRDDTVNRAFLAQADGSVWIGTGKGASHLLHPDRVLQRPPFAVAIEEAQYGARSLLGGRTLDWNGATPSIRFSAITFRDSHKLLYHSQMLGFDLGETVSKASVVSYPRLPPGSYTFRVYAEDTGDGVMSAPAELTFELTPPWWRTVWAQVLAILFGLGIIAGLWYVLHLALLAQQRKLQQMVEQRTEELQKQANHDSLTGLLNRRALFEALSKEIDRAARRRTQLCVAIIDLDHFKQINDTFGHLAGDEVLRQTATLLGSVLRTSGMRKSDIIGRYGGEEFLVIFRDAKHSLGMARCESIRQAICERPMRYENQEITVTCSIGLARLHRPPESVAELLTQADKALYRAKEKGRNLVQCAKEEWQMLLHT